MDNAWFSCSSAIVIPGGETLLCFLRKMKKAQLESYEIYNNFPEAFTPPTPEEEEHIFEYDILPQQANAIRLAIKNDITNTFNHIWKGKNKGRKKRERAHTFGLKHGTANTNNDIGSGKCDTEKTSSFLWKILPSGSIVKETKSYAYLLCPFHKEKHASMAIGKKSWIVKCYGCGRGFALDTFLSIILGNTKRYWGKQLIEATNDQTNPQIDKKSEQLLLFPIDKSSIGRP